MVHSNCVGRTIIAMVCLVFLSGCGATKVELPMNIAEKFRTEGYQMPQHEADLVVVMNEVDAGLRYMAAIHDIKLQLNVGKAYKQNILGVMGLMFNNVEHVNSLQEFKKSAADKNTYLLDVAFQFVRVTIPRTRFGRTQAHIVTRYNLHDSNGATIFSYIDYAPNTRSNAVLISNPWSLHGEGNLVRSVMDISMVTSIMQLAAVIDKYMNPNTRKQALRTIADHEKSLYDAAKPYIARIKSSNYQDKSQAAAELRENFGVLAMVQNEIEAELLRLADQHLADNFAAAAAKQMCADLSISGRHKYLQTFQHLAANAKDPRLRKLGQSYYNYLLKSLCGAGHCVEEAPAAS